MLGDEGSYMPVSDDFLTAGLKITGHFEDSDDPLAAVSGITFSAFPGRLVRFDTLRVSAQEAVFRGNL